MCLGAGQRVDDQKLFREGQKFIEEEYQTESDDVELLEIWEALPAEEKMYQNEEIELSDFLEADERLETRGSSTLEQIAEEMLGSKELAKIMK